MECGCHASPFFITHAHAHENEERLQRKVGEAEWEAIVWKSMTNWAGKAGLYIIFLFSTHTL